MSDPSLPQQISTHLVSVGFPILTTTANTFQAEALENTTKSKLNARATRVDQRLETLGKGVEEAQGRALLAEARLRSSIQEVESKVTDNLQQMADAGVAALTQTIDNFEIELGKH